jgi:hypothetical protein
MHQLTYTVLLSIAVYVGYVRPIKESTEYMSTYETVEHMSTKYDYFVIFLLTLLYLCPCCSFGVHPMVCCPKRLDKERSVTYSTHTHHQAYLPLKAKTTHISTY